MLLFEGPAAEGSPEQNKYNGGKSKNHMIGNKKLHTASRIAVAVLALLLAVLIAGTYAGSTYSTYLNNVLQIETTRVVTDENETADTQYYKSDYSSQDELYNAKEALIQEIVREGAVLLKNEGNALPLDASSENQVSLFGRSSVEIIQGIHGGASIIESVSDPLTEVLASVGLTVNPTLYSFYENSGYEYNYGGSTVTIGEVPVSEYTSAVRSSYSQYSDAAIIVLSRSGGEGDDISLDPADVTDGDGVHYTLALQQNERDMIEEAKSCSDKVIVLVNSDYAMEIDELKDDPEIDAILWIGGTGLNGTYGVADLLVGNTSPSGRLADTYAASVASSPAAQNWGAEQYTNVTEDLQAYYTVYQEGIYVGYKYYETRYEDYVLNRYNARSSTGAYASDSGWNYEDEVSYSFGYGLSYSTFTEEITGFSLNGTTATMQVRVTNTGDYDGKHVVQVYAQSPYTEYDVTNKVEKASVQLVGFAKTDVLEADGGSETVTVEIDLHNLASYDYTNAKTYIMEAGTYYFAIGNGAHDALNNILAAKGYDTDDGMDQNGDGSEAKVRTHEQEEDDFETYSVSWQNGTEITNQLDSADINYYGDFVTYLSRSDWSGTWPKSELNITATDEMIADLQDGASYTPTEATAEDQAEMVYDSDETSYPLIMLRGEDFESEYWDDILNQLSLYEMSRLIGASGGGLIACDSITFAGSVMRDGPAGPKANYTEGEHVTESAVMFQSEVVLASTFNTEMAAAEGAMMGNDSLWLNTNAMYAPGVDTHRTPMSGRNSEYYSEDSVLSSEMGTAQIVAAAEYGLILGPKHFAFNDQETHRNGLGTFLNEQAAREIYLRAFEKPMTNSLGMMSAYNRVGCTYSSAHVGLMSNILRGEWGFKGYAISDAVGSRSLSRYADGAASVTAGLTVFCVTVETLYCGSGASLSEEAIIADPVLFEAVREACHYNLYAFLNSSAINGYTSSMHIEHLTPWYMTAVIAADIVVGVLLAAGLAGYIFLTVRGKKEVQNG